MCGIQIGVAKRIDVERISKEIAELALALEQEIENDNVTIEVDRVKRVTKALDNIIAAKP